MNEQNVATTEFSKFKAVRRCSNSPTSLTLKFLNYSERLDIPWQDAFQTTEKDKVEEYCRSAHTEFEWREGIASAQSKCVRRWLLIRK